MPNQSETMISFIQNTLRGSAARGVFEQYLQKSGCPSKWLLLTDYCLDAPNKANVITYVLLFFKNERTHSAIKKKILKLQKTDIKHTRHISNRLMRYLKRLPVFSFSFILDKRDQLFGDTLVEQQQAVIDGLTSVRDCFKSWLNSAPDANMAAYYRDSIKKLDTQIKQGSLGKNLSLHEDILLTASLGALYTAEILRGVPDLKTVGWFSDRDRITQSCNEIVIPVFHAFLHNFLAGRDVKVAFADPNLNGVPFYDDLNRIPDDICAAIADFAFMYPSISKKKFSHVLHELMVGNPFMRVHRLYKDATGYHLSALSYHTTVWMSVKFYCQTMARDMTGFVKMVRNRICRMNRD